MPQTNLPTTSWWIASMLTMVLFIGVPSLGGEVNENRVEPPTPRQGPPKFEQEHEHALEKGPLEFEWVGRGLPWWQWSHATGNWNDWRTRAQDHGLTIEGGWLFDASKVESGGTRRRTTGRSLLYVDALLDLEPLLGLPHAEVGLQFYSHSGRDGSAELGVVQAYSNIDARNTQQLAQFWFEQRWIEDRIRLRVGKMDANGEFAWVDAASRFLHSSMGFSPTILSLPTYPNPSTGGILFGQVCDGFELGVGVFDGAGQEGERTGRKGIGTLFGDPSDLFLIGEGRLTWELPFASSLSGRFAVGGWHHTGTFARFSGGPDKGTEGLYLVAEQRLWRPAAQPATDDGEAAAEGTVDDDRGISAFAQFGTADEAVSSVEIHIGGGIRWRGLFAARPGDVIGCGFSRAELTDRMGSGFSENSEVAYEFFYSARITPWMFVQPDVQFIKDPGGDASVNDATIISVRVRLLF